MPSACELGFFSTVHFYVMAADDELMSAVIKMQCIYRSRLARKKVSATCEHQVQKWVETTHDDGTVYYFNTETNEAQDLKPADFRVGMILLLKG